VYFDVLLQPDEHGLGFCLAMNDTSHELYVTSFRRRHALDIGPAEASQQIQQHDILLSINGMEVFTLPHVYRILESLDRNTSKSFVLLRFHRRPAATTTTITSAPFSNAICATDHDAKPNTFSASRYRSSVQAHTVKIKDTLHDDDDQDDHEDAHANDPIDCKYEDTDNDHDTHPRREVSLAQLVHDLSVEKDIVCAQLHEAQVQLQSQQVDIAALEQALAEARLEACIKTSDTLSSQASSSSSSIHSMMMKFMTPNGTSTDETLSEHDTTKHKKTKSQLQWERTLHECHATMKKDALEQARLETQAQWQRQEQEWQERLAAHKKKEAMLEEAIQSILSYVDELETSRSREPVPPRFMMPKDAEVTSSMIMMVKMQRIRQIVLGYMHQRDQRMSVEAACDAKEDAATSANIRDFPTTA
jgi:hypothetical protein